MLKYHTSLRERSAIETIQIAKQYAIRYGITRVTNTTLLDVIGIPVYAAIRPEADLSSLCVCAGKGLLPIEAEVGAYMEAIEFALSEHRHSHVKTSWSKVQDIYDGHLRDDAILDFCPKIGMEIDLEDRIEYATAIDLISNKSYKVPAELVFMPYHNRENSASYFGSHTNGLASGNSSEEACIHGILEVVERDVLSLQTVNKTSLRLDATTYPENVKKIADNIASAGLELVVDYVENEWELPFFSASLIDHQTRNPIYINGGFGCHFDKKIALMRSVTEALQSRLSFIHGGRDDLIDDYENVEKLSEEEKYESFKKSANKIASFKTKIDFSEISEPFQKTDTIKSNLENLLSHLKAKGILHVLKVSHTLPEEPLSVVKIIIPKMEFFTPINLRVGKRLRDHAKNIADHTFRRAEPNL